MKSLRNITSVKINEKRQIFDKLEWRIERTHNGNHFIHVWGEPEIKMIIPVDDPRFELS